MQEIWDLGLIPWMRRSPGEGPRNPLQHSCLENPMERGAWWTTVHGVTKSGAQLSMQTTIASIFPSHWQCSLSSWATCCLCMLRFRNEDKSVGEKWDKSRAPLSLRFSCRVNGCLFVKKKKSNGLLFVKDPGFRAGRRTSVVLRQLASDWLGSDQQRLSSFGSMSLKGTNFCMWVMWINITNLFYMCLVIS